MAFDAATTYTVPIWIEGKTIASHPEKFFAVTNGSSSKLLHNAANADLETVTAATESSWKAFQSWKRTPFAARRDLLNKFADVLERDADKLIQCMVDEISCPPFFAKLTYDKAIAKARETAALLLSVFGTVVTGFDEPAVHGFVFKEPIGPVLLISPWNTPTFLAVRAISQAIGAGCSVVFKASELSPRSHYMIVEALTEAGAPPGLLSSLQVRRENASKITEALISNKRIRKIDFIGSAATGRIIASLSGKHLKPCILELGGKCPALILEDANIEVAATLRAQGSMMYHGRLCTSTDRIIVQESIAEQFQAALLENLTAMPGFQGSAINETSAKHAYDVICDAQAQGHKFLYGKPEYESSTSLAPVVVLNPKGSRMEDEETFGPSVSLYVVKTQQAAIDLANDSEYGYSASIHSRDMDRAITIARELDFGMVNCNNIQFFNHTNSPTGGMKSTGWGRSSGLWGINEFLVEKSFTYKSA